MIIYYEQSKLNQLTNYYGIYVNHDQFGYYINDELFNELAIDHCPTRDDIERFFNMNSDQY